MTNGLDLRTQLIGRVLSSQVRGGNSCDWLGTFGPTKVRSHLHPLLVRLGQIVFDISEKGRIP